MKKSAILAVLCLGAMLTGCGKVDPVESESISAETTVAVEKNTGSTTDAAEDETKSTTTASTSSDKSKTTTKSKATTTTTAKRVSGGGTTVYVAKRTGNAPVQTTKRTGNAPVQSTTGTTTTTTTTTAALPSHTVFSKDKLECRVTTDGVEVSLDEKQLQTIDIDTEELLAALSDVKTELKASIIIDDIDLDGHDDLFIPQQVGTLNTFGVYYHYDDKDEKYVKWEELSEIDSRAEVNEENKTFTTDVKLSDDEYEVKVFEWKDGKPSVQTIKKQYKSAENKDELLIDYFDCSSGEKQLVKRERVLFDSEGRIAGAEEVELD